MKYKVKFSEHSIVSNTLLSGVDKRFKNTVDGHRRPDGVFLNPMMKPEKTEDDTYILPMQVLPDSLLYFRNI